MMVLVVLEGPGRGKRYRLNPGLQTAGREPVCEIHLASPRVSRRHASFEVMGDRCVVRDLGSSNGLRINGHDMEACELIDGTQVLIGDVLLVFQTGVMDEEVTNPVADARPTAIGAPPPDFGEPAPTEHHRDLPSSQHGDFGAAPQGPHGGFGGPPQGGFGGPPQGGFGGAPQGGFGDFTPPPGQDDDSSRPAFVPMSGEDHPSQSTPFGPAGDDATGIAPIAQGPQAPPRDAAPSPAPGPKKSPFDLLNQKLPFGIRAGLLVALAGFIILCGPVGGVFALGRAGDRSVEDMSVERGIVLAEAIGHRNANELAGNGVDFELVPFQGETGVLKAWVVDARGQVVAPQDRIGASLSGDELFSQARKERTVATQDAGDHIRIVAPIKAQPTSGGSYSVVGYAYLEYDPVPATGDVASVGARVVLTLLLLLAVGGGLTFAMVRMASGPVRRLQEDGELALKGHPVPVASASKWGPLEDLAATLRRSMERGGSAGPDPRIATLLASLDNPVFVVDRDLRVQASNAWAEHLAGRAVPAGTALAGALPEVSDRLTPMLPRLRPDQPVLEDNLTLQGQGRRLVAAAGYVQGQLDHLVLVIQ